MISDLTGGKWLLRETAKNITPAHTAGGWHLFSGLAGFPNATTFPNTTDLMWTQCTEQEGDGTTIFGLQHGGNLASPMTKHILTAGAMLVASNGPWLLRLLDIQGYYRISGSNLTGTGSRTCINGENFVSTFGTDIITYAYDWRNLTKVRFTTTGTLPGGLSLATDYWLIRQSSTTAKVASSFANAIAGTFIDITDDGTGTHTLTIQMPRYAFGAGCDAFFVIQTAPTAGGPNLSASSYTNQTPATGRAFVMPCAFGAAANAYATRIPHSGTAATQYGMFLPKQGGDSGIAKVDSFTLSGGTAYTGSGVAALVIARNLIPELPIPSSGIWTERDMESMMPSLPRIEDGACLAWACFANGATTNNAPFVATLGIGWGGV